MNQIAPIFKKEFFGYFRSPVGYVILAVFHIVLIGLAIFAGYYESNQASLDTIWTFLPWTFLIFIPATGMRLWSEEKRSGSIELLFTLPIPTVSAVLGKFLAAWAFIGIALALTFSLALTTSYLGNPDWGIIFSGYFGSVLMAAAYLSISSVCSALTKKPSDRFCHQRIDLRAGHTLRFANLANHLRKYCFPWAPRLPRQLQFSQSLSDDDSRTH